MRRVDLLASRGDRPEGVIERRLRSGRGVWREIRQDGIVVAGSTLGELENVDVYIAPNQI